jgi:hypothetical protein
MFLMEIVSAYLSQSVYSIGQYKEKTQVKIKLQQFLDLRLQHIISGIIKACRTPYLRI